MTHTTARRVRVRAGSALAALLVLVACTGEPSTPDEPSGPATEGSSSPTGPTASPSASADPAPLRSVRLRPPEDGSFLVRGRYPRVESSCVDHEQPRLLARYPGTLSIAREDDGTLSVTVTLDFDRYLEGIAEVPSSWPRAALEAQAVAARSYALATTDWSGEEGESLATPICATTACQVYRGIPVPFEPTIRRWYAAVRRTDGDVLVFEGRPADTVYFSTSNGQTYGNEDVFGSAPLPYLRPVIEEDDGASPVSRWSVRLPFVDLATFLREAGEWPRARRITGVDLDGSTVNVVGPGTTRAIDLATFREAVNTWAPCLAPDRYPPGALPVTIPSRWMAMSSGADAVAIRGRGWGHGAGMVQWGAYGKAQRGLSAADILAFYYGGLRPEPYPEPGLIDVQVASGLTSLRVVPSAPGARVNGQEIGSGSVTILGGDRLTVGT
jgi:SpoIID/LytB domain protein